MRFHPKTERLLDQMGTNVETWRVIQGLTASEVADRAGITRNTLRTIESDPARASFGNVLAVLAVLGIDEALAAAIDPAQSFRGQSLLTAKARGEI